MMDKKFNKVFILLFISVAILICLIVLMINNYNNKEKAFACGVISEPEPYCGTTDYSKTIEAGVFNNLTGETLFIENCKVCHDVGIEKVGPSLKNIHKR